jgi:hypothetical protein
MTPQDAASLAKAANDVGAGNLALGIIGVAFIAILGALIGLAVWATREMLKNAAVRGREERQIWAKQQDKALESHERIVKGINENHKEEIQKITAGLDVLRETVTDVKNDVKEIRNRLEEVTQ